MVVINHFPMTYIFHIKGYEMLISALTAWSWVITSWILYLKMGEREKEASILIIRSLQEWGLPQWLSGKEPTCQCRRHRFELWSRRMPHPAEQPNLCTTTAEPGSHSCWAHVLQILKPAHSRAPAPQQEKPPQRGARAVSLESSLRSQQPEKSPRCKENSAQP